MKWFALVMSVVYVIAGCLLIFTSFAADVIRDYRMVLGGVLIGYGLLRGSLWVRKHNESKAE
ncbi:MAG: hypothetical protein R2815_14440 [Flavobacteriales bacterium]